MSIPSHILNEVNQITNDRQHGARELSRISLQSIKRFLEQSSKEDGRAPARLLLDVAKAFAEARPSMASITNMMAAFAYNIWNEEQMTSESAINIVDTLLSQQEQTFQKLISNTENLIKKDDIIITCSYSSTITQALIKAKEVEPFKVIILKSPSPDWSIDYGVLLHNKLSQAGLPTEILDENDEEISKKIGSVDYALVGADSIYPDGSILNGTPALILAEEAFKNGKSFYVSCETIKINAMPLIGFTHLREKGMDHISSELISSIITENGLLYPRMIPNYAQKFADRMKILYKSSMI